MRDDLLPEGMAEEIEAVWRSLAADGLGAVAVTSANAHEGASTVAAALAKRSVLAGKTTLLAELSPARPALAQRMGLELQPGVPVRVGADGFGVVSVPADAGDDWRDPAYLAWKMSEWQRDWGMVVLDAPALLSPAPLAGPSGLAIAAKAPTTLLVVLAGRTKADKVRQAQEKLLRAGGSLAGVVMNDRENPSLRQEVERELSRLARWAPGLVSKARARLRRSPILGIRA